MTRHLTPTPFSITCPFGASTPALARIPQPGFFMPVSLFRPFCPFSLSLPRSTPLFRPASLANLKKNVSANKLWDDTVGA